MAWIQNISLASAIKGEHMFTPGNTILIQIQDFGTWQFVKPKHEFLQVYQFKFDDHEDPNLKTNIAPDQADQIARILTLAYEQGVNVVVHCHAGLCRSGAVAEVGIMMGFDEVHKNRQPNVLVKNRLRKSLGLETDYADIFKGYDEQS